MATLKDIAKEVGISVSAASLALRDHRTISVETKQKVWQAQEKLGYRLHLRAQRSNGGEPVNGTLIRNIAFLLIDRDFENPLYGMSFQRIAEAAALRHWRSMYVAATLKDLHEGRIPPLLQNGGIDGIVVSGVYDRIAHRSLSSLDLPLVIMGPYDLDGDNWMSCEPDIRSGARVGVERLAELGHTRFGLIIGDADSEFGFQIQQTYLREVKRRGGVSVGVHYALKQDAKEGAIELLKKGATCLLLGSGTFSLDVYEACGELGLKIPSDVSIISFRGGILYPLKPSLVMLATKGVSNGIVEKMASLIEDRGIQCTRELYPLKLIPGGSIGKAPLENKFSLKTVPRQKL